jgi:flagellar protein FliO/FliZ
MDSNMLAMVRQSLLGLSLVLGLFALIVWGVRRFQQHNHNALERDFKIIQRLHLDNKNSLVEIRHQGRHYVLGLSPGGMVQLHSDHALKAALPVSIQADEHD